MMRLAEAIPLHEGLVGCLVEDQDGQPVGVLQDTCRHYFKIAAPVNRAYWLAEDYIGSVSDGSVRLSLTNENLDDYILDHPDDY
jgi:hypothetical protein